MVTSVVGDNPEELPLQSLLLLLLISHAALSLFLPPFHSMSTPLTCSPSLSPIVPAPTVTDDPLHVLTGNLMSFKASVSPVYFIGLSCCSSWRLLLMMLCRVLQLLHSCLTVDEVSLPAVLCPLCAKPSTTLSTPWQHINVAHISRGVYPSLCIFQHSNRLTYSHPSCCFGYFGR